MIPAGNPHQKVSKALIFADIPIDPEKEDALIHYADIHSHNSMAAQFSSIDDADEKGDRLYLVMGRLDQYFPEVSARICNGGTFLPIHPSDVLEDSFPITGEKQLLKRGLSPKRIPKH